MNILRILHNANESYRSAKTNQDARSVWSTVAAVLFAMWRTDDWDVPTWQFLGRSAEPVPTGASALELRPGLGLWYDAAEDDDFTGELKPIFIPSTVAVPIETNQDASGDDRIDLVCLRPTLEEEYEEDDDGDRLQTWFKDPDDGTRYKKAEPQRERWVYEYKVIKGEPDSDPEAPDTPDGWVAVAEVRRVQGASAVTDEDVTDVRPTATGLEAYRMATERLELPGDDGIVRWESDDGEQIEFRVGSNPRSLILATDLMGTTPDGSLQLEKLTAWGEVLVDKITGAVEDVITFEDTDGDLAKLEAKNTLKAAAAFEFPDPGSDDFSDGDTADLKSSMGVDSVTYRDDSDHGGVYLEVDLDGDVLDGDNGLVAFQAGGRQWSGGSTLSQITSNVRLIDSTTAEVYLFDENGDRTDPPHDTEHMIFVYQLDG